MPLPSWISAPVPELTIFRTAPEAEAYCWFMLRILDESVQVPPVLAVQLLLNEATAPVVVSVAALTGFNGKTIWP